MLWASTLDGLSPLEKLAMMMLGKRANADGSSFMKHDTIAQLCGCSRRSIISTMAELEAKNLIKREHRPRPKGSGRSSDLVTIQCEKSALRKLEFQSAKSAPTNVQNFHTNNTTPYGVSKNSKKEGAVG